MNLSLNDLLEITREEFFTEFRKFPYVERKALWKVIERETQGLKRSLERVRHGFVAFICQFRKADP